MIFIGLILMVGVLAFGLTAFSLWISEVERERVSQTTQGRPIEYEPDNHNRVKYEYFVAGNRYVGEASSGNDYKLGATYPVHYDPNNPSLSFLGADVPHSLGRNLRDLALIGSLMVTVAILARLTYKPRCP
jgi:hypothetical protein